MQLRQLRFLCLIAVCGSLLLSLPALAQTQSGNIFGRAVDQAGGVFPGVMVTLTGVGAPQVFVTDTEGKFRFLNLSPGTYTIVAELSGFAPVTHSNIQVNLGRNAEVDILMEAAITEAITIVADAPLLDVRKAGTGATVTSIELQEVPTGRDPWVILQQTPGVMIDRINVGGNESGQQSGYVAKGAEDTQSSWNVDGVNITDVGALGSSPTYYDFDSFEEMQITTGGVDPRIQTPGAQINMVTKRGTNSFTGSFRYFMTDGEYQSDPQIPGEASGYLGAVNEVDATNEYGFEVGGPIIRDKLWFWGAYGRQNVDLQVAQPVGQERRYTDKTDLENFNAKLNWQVSTTNFMSIAAMLGNKIKLGRNVGPSRPPETAWNQDSSYSGPTMIKIEDTHIFNPNFYLTGLLSHVEGGFQLISDNGEMCTTIECGLSGPVSYLDLFEAGAWANSFYNYYTERPQDQLRVDGSAFFSTGNIDHELKFGFGYRDAEVLSQSGWPGDQYVVFYDQPGLEGSAGGTALFRQTDFTYNAEFIDFYIGDTMMFGNMTLQAALRYDRQTGSVQDGTIKANSVLPDEFPSITFDGSSIGEIEWSSVSPRLGLTYALGAERKSLIRAAANRYVDQIGGSTVYAASPLGYQYLYYYFTDLNGNKQVDPGEIDCPECGPVAWYGVDPEALESATPVNRWDPGIDAPTTDEFILGYEQEIARDFAVSVTGTYRKLKDFIQFRGEKTRGSGDYYTSADYEFVTNVSGTRPDGSSYTVGYYDLKEGVAPPTYFVITNRPGYSQEYTGLELALTKRMSSRWMARASFTWQDWTQNVAENEIVDPTIQRTTYGCAVCDGAAVFSGSGTGSGAKGGIYMNSEWMYNLTGTYTIPKIETNIGFNLTGRQGYPIPYAHRVFTSEGFKYLLTDADPVRYRHEDIMSLDLRLSKEIKLGPTGLVLSVDCFNIMNEQPILQRNTRLNYSAANRITEIQSPRIFRFGARFTF